MSGELRKKYDNGIVGLCCGLMAPILTLYIFYLFKYSHMSFWKFYVDVLSARNIVTAAISLCVITNLLVFFIFIWTNRNFSARGVLLSTFIYAGYVVYQKYL